MNKAITVYEVRDYIVKRLIEGINGSITDAMEDLGCWCSYNLKGYSKEVVDELVKIYTEAGYRVEMLEYVMRLYW